MKFRIFEEYPELKYGISEKSDGAMKFDAKRRDAYFSQLGKATPYVLADVVHGTKIAAIDMGNRGSALSDTDGLITQVGNLFLTITVADCFPVYFYDPAARIIGLAHAGWRGVSKNIVKEVIKVLKKSGGGGENLLVGMGPGIRECHFEVKEEVAKIFGTKEKFINLSGIIQGQLGGLGVKTGNIEDSGECTFCLSDKYFSYRRDKLVQVEAMIGYIGIKHD